MAFILTTRRYPQRRRRGFAGMGDCGDPSIVAKITAAANARGVPPAIALAVAQQESQCNQAAKNNNSNGTVDIGMFQLNSATFPGASSLTVDQNIQQGVGYLAQMYQRFGDWYTALAAYNGGPGAVAGGTVKPVPAVY